MFVILDKGHAFDGNSSELDLFYKRLKNSSRPFNDESILFGHKKAKQDSPSSNPDKIKNPDPESPHKSAIICRSVDYFSSSQKLKKMSSYIKPENQLKSINISCIPRRHFLIPVAMNKTRTLSYAGYRLVISKYRDVITSSGKFNKP